LAPSDYNPKYQNVFSPPFSHQISTNPRRRKVKLEKNQWPPIKPLDAAAAATAFYFASALVPVSAFAASA